MVTLLKTYWRILLKQLGPANLPASDVLLLATVLLNAVIFFVSGVMATQDLATLTILYGLRIVGLFAFVLIVLTLYKKPMRWRETAMALLGVQALVELITLPVAALYLWQPDNPMVREIVVIIGLMVLIWIVIVNTHIIQQAIEQTFYIALLFVIAHAAVMFWFLQFFIEVEA